MYYLRRVAEKSSGQISALFYPDGPDQIWPRWHGHGSCTTTTYPAGVDARQ
jgi:hypothetical protein